MPSDAKYFIVVDANLGYWQIKLDDESSLLTTFNTPFRRYRFTTMFFDVHSSQEVFQKTTDMAFEGVSGCKSIIDDMLAGDHPKSIMTRILRWIKSVPERLGSNGMLRRALQ